MTVAEVREKYLKFFEKREHARIPSSSLLPENDPTTLFTGSGMQPLLPFLLGENHPKGNRLVNSQKCFRAEDIEEVGDNRHTTFFEMLGNWSLGDYFKKEQLPWFFEFLTEEVGLDPNRLYVTVFIGDSTLDIPKDEESIEIWKSLFAGKGIEATSALVGSEEAGYARGMNEGERIFEYDAKKNWWSRAGEPGKMPAGEPGGPDSEVFYDFGPTTSSGQARHDSAFGEHCHPNCDCGRFMEIGNSVFMEYIKNEDGTFSQLLQKNVDFGGGLERIVAAKNNDPDVFAVDVFFELLREIELTTDTKYSENKEAYRVIADHLRAAVFAVADGALPSNKDAGYFTRRLIRRAVFKLNALKEFSATTPLVESLAKSYHDSYPRVSEQKEKIIRIVEEEGAKFKATLERGMKEFEKRAGNAIDADTAFTLFTTYGFPIELIEEIALERGISLDLAGFKEKMKGHQELSRAGAEQKFKGGLADTSETTTMLHSATHLMLAGLRKYLGEDVHQAGSNITSERTRFDFTHPEKLGPDTLEKVEQYVNSAIEARAKMIVEEVPKDVAQKEGVEGSFWEKYPDIVTVYTFRDAEGVTWSRELCGGPHVGNTAEIKGVFKITKEESVAAGVRRIKAILT